jgi:hypothetical protein
LRENRDQIKKKSPNKYKEDFEIEDIKKAVNPLDGHPLLEKKMRKKQIEQSKLKNYDNLEELNNDREFKENLKIKYDSDKENEEMNASGNKNSISPSKHGHLNAKKRVKETFQQ